MTAAFLPKDFLETKEGLIFAVVARGEEAGRVLSFLRYQRVESGYKKLSTTAANALLRNYYPEYIYYSKKRAVQLHAVATGRILVHHQPRTRLNELLTSQPADRIEKKLIFLLQQFAQQGLNTTHLGVTGSLLIGAQNQNSDIDLVCYERTSFFKTREIIQQLLAREILQPLGEALWLDAYNRRGCDLTFDEFCWHEQRKYNKAAIQQTKFDLSLVEPKQSSTPHQYHKLGQVSIQATVLGDVNAFDYPARYQIEHPSVSEVISYTATYAGQAQTGETIAVRGQLERSDQGTLQIVVGTDREAAGEYIKVSQPSNC